MRTTIRKCFFVWQFEEEEKWLNEMAARGKALVSVGLCTYIFEDCEPGEYICRMELLENLPSSAEGRSYIEFLEETGAEQVGSYLRWCYFRRKASLGAFDLFSDFESRIRHLNRILLLVFCCLPMELYFGLWNVLGFSHRTGNLLAGIFCLLVAALLIAALILVGIKKHKLQKERKICES